jgi:cytidine deaminase
MAIAIANEDLINAAKEARKSAYCRYSGFSVGAAIIDDQDRLHVGCNVENAAYNLGNCAEAAAIAAMVQEGGKRIVRMAVAGGRSAVAAAGSALSSSATKILLSSSLMTATNGKSTQSIRCCPHRSIWTS